MQKKNIWKWGVMVLAVCFLGARTCAQTVDVKIRVLDQDGIPVAGVKVDCESQQFLRKKGDGKGNRFAAKLSDKDGLAVIRSRKRSFTERILLLKNGYYHTQSRTLSPMGKDYPPKEPIELIIKKIKKPIPMWAKKNKPLKLPKYNGEEFGYDLLIGDWVAPYGSGKVFDFIFQFDGVYSNKPYGSLEQYDHKIILRFSNEKDGIRAYKGQSEDGWIYGSDFVSDYKAPLTGYSSKWEQRTWKEKGGYHQTTRDMNQNFYFRVRTKMDEKGNIISAHYGKIYGDFMSFTYYLNPTPNDINVEFDLNKNLFKGEEVTKP